METIKGAGSVLRPTMYIAINISHPDSKGVPNIPKIETSVEILDIEDGHLWETGNSKELVQHVPGLCGDFRHPNQIDTAEIFSICCIYHFLKPLEI